MSVDLVVSPATSVDVPMNINDNGTLGTAVSLPLATTSGVGLMSADDKTKSDDTLTNTGIKNATSNDNSEITMAANGTLISRNVNDANAVAILNNVNSSFSGSIASFQNLGTTLALIDRFGYGRLNRVGIGSVLTIPNHLLEVKAGTVAGANIIASFSQNAGSIQIENGTATSAAFNPTIRGIATGTNPWGILVQGQGSSSYSYAGIVLRAADATGTGSVTGGNTFQLENNTTPQLTVDHSGVVTISDLAGTGTRMVTADSTGALSATMEVSSGTYVPTITGPDTYTPSGFRFTRVGNVVHVSGAIEVDSTSIGSLQFNISLPPSISTTFTDEYDVTGVVSGLYSLQDCFVGADYVNNEPTVRFTSSVSTTSNVFVQFDFIIQ